MIPYILEVVTYKERRKIMELYKFIKAFFLYVESGLDDAFEVIDKILGVN